MRWTEEGLLFGTHPVPLEGRPPRWTADPLGEANPQSSDPQDLPPWWRIGDFAGGDIKRIWDFSRLDWVMTFAQQARNGDPAALDRMNEWLDDWVSHNPPYRGPNWKCAQEASIRVLHLSIAAAILGGEDRLSDSLHALLQAHVRRIIPTLSYARAQANNHAISEAAALFVAGAWMTVAGRSGGAEYVRRGRALLERHVAHLFARDGSFSQYSVNYHRMALDTLAMAELWRRRARLPAFGLTFRKRAAAASDWLRVIVDDVSGDAPNLGANDGAWLLPLTEAPYRDYRPSVQLATALFCNARAYPAGGWDDLLSWLDVDPPTVNLSLPETAIFDDGGYAILRHGSALAVLRYPRFQFRPSQSDILHVDLWIDGQNLLRDGGSYSYNTDTCWMEYFSGVASHNTIQFDDQPQMPQLSRFLLGDWLKTEKRLAGQDRNEPGFRASYRHRSGWRHDRELRLRGSLKVVDRISGFRREAKLRWRLRPGPWRVEGASVTDGQHRLSLVADMPIIGFTLATGYESRHYFEKTPLPVLEIVVSEPGKIVSTYQVAS